MIELSDEIDEDMWIDHSLPLAFNYFSTNYDLLEYLGAHLELLKSNEKCHASYMLHEYTYYSHEVNFHDVLQVQPLEEVEITDLTMEDLKLLLKIKKDLTFP